MPDSGACPTIDSTASWGCGWRGKWRGCRDTAASSHSSLAQGELMGKLELLVCVRCCGQRPNRSRTFWRARHVQLPARQPTSRRPSPPWHRPPHRPGPVPALWAGVSCREGRCADWAGVLVFSPHPLAPPARAGVRCGAGVQGCSESLCGNPEFANRVPTSTPRAWGAHAARPHFLLPSMPFLGLAPHRSQFSHSLASRSADALPLGWGALASALHFGPELLVRNAPALPDLLPGDRQDRLELP